MSHIKEQFNQRLKIQSSFTHPKVFPKPTEEEKNTSMAWKKKYTMEANGKQQLV